MSKFSGKCDFADHIEIFGVESILNSKVYVNGIGPLKFESEKDMIPYYPYIIWTSYISKEDGVIHLSRKSFIDSEDEEHVSWYLNDVLRVYKKCKRKKIDFTIDEIHKMIGDWSFTNWKNYYIEIYDRVCKNGIKADVHDLHSPMSNIYRTSLIEVAEQFGCENHPLLLEVKDKIKEFNVFIEKYKKEK